MSNVNLNFNNSNAISGFDNPGMIAPNKDIAIGGEPNSAGKAGWGHDTLPGLENLTGKAAEQVLSASKELATAYEDVMARIGQSSEDGAPGHVLDNLKRVASDILAGAKELFSALDDPALVFKGKAGASDSVAAAAAAVLEGVQANMGELSKISKDPGIYFPDLSETAAPETKAEISADTKSSPDIESPRMFNEELRTAQGVVNPNITAPTSAGANALQGSREVGGVSGPEKQESKGGLEGNKGTANAGDSTGLAGNDSTNGRTAAEWKELLRKDPQAFGKAIEGMESFQKEDILNQISEFTQLQNRINSALSNLMMTEHQTQKAIIQNFRV